VPSVPFPLSTNYRLALSTPSSLIRLLHDTFTNLVHVHSPCTLGKAALGYAQSFGVPTVATYHTHFPSYLGYYKLGFLSNTAWNYLRSFYGRCDAVVVPSKRTMLELESHGL